MTEKNHNSDNDNDFVRQYGKSAKVKFIPKKSDKLKLCPNKNYFYIQTRNSRYYFCKRCFEYFGIYYRGRFEGAPIYSPKFDVYSQGEMFFPEECPHCYVDFSNKLACDRCGP